MAFRFHKVAILGSKLGALWRWITVGQQHWDLHNKNSMSTTRNATFIEHWATRVYTVSHWKVLIGLCLQVVSQKYNNNTKCMLFPLKVPLFHVIKRKLYVCERPWLYMVIDDSLNPELWRLLLDHYQDVECWKMVLQGRHGSLLCHHAPFGSWAEDSDSRCDHDRWLFRHEPEAYGYQLGGHQSVGQSDFCEFLLFPDPTMTALL